MRIQPIMIPDRPGDPSDDDLVAGLHAAYVAGYQEDAGPVVPLARFRRDMCAHSPSQQVEACALIDGEQVVGGYALAFPQLDNRRAGWIFPLVVQPGHRGRGLGAALFGHALDRMRAHGRTLLLTETPATGTGARFAGAHGMSVALSEARRTLDLRKADWPALERMLPEVSGYTLERWIGPAAPERLPDLATLLNGMNDAPRHDDVEEQNFSLERLRAREESMPEIGQTCYTTIARRDSDGAPAAYTRIFLDTGRTDGWAQQGDTAVLRAHRGHRLGLLLKLSNLLWLREHEPQAERVITWNATSNRHMLAINEAMGFELFDEWHQWRLTL
ncbi:GNAT family N-acetyltransferase [Nonomuraea gerenzanensis]|uniref:GCN5-related N-acetyltransferase n=1 Tax=Nonomuraea gerenzanensis TaxID=93944 RepID=A0A1M4E3X9_9ACTN|nr:GNAT family N-acetyltransferase [Nonomuraea gerenzanensis]UBU15750.1 GNAT family N-acetyltransferase [Nonomuraea gerenzanensis]SBO93529.1 GCN5-related N-acetyltransferase [Nonomuraea gerenzanensis]